MSDKKMGLDSTDALNYANLIAELAPLAIELALKLQGIISATNAGTATTDSLTADALAANTEAITKANAWLAAKGFPTV